jgi:uncharacterized OB-fold protein
MRPFWEGLRRGEFLLTRCVLCGAWRWPIAGCREHPNEPYLRNVVWTPASGRGRILTYSVQHASFDPGFATPYVYAVVALDEGPVIPTNIIRCAPEAVTVGMPVRVAYGAIGETDTVALFEPAA